MKCAIKCIKCITDRAISAINCVGVPSSALIIYGKHANWGLLKNAEWGIVLLPAIIIILVNLLYCTLCNILLKPSETEDNYGSIV